MLSGIIGHLLILKKIKFSRLKKKRISNKLFGRDLFFSNVEEFNQLSKEYINNFGQNNTNEIYIAPLYDYAISKSLLISPMKCDYVKIFGTCE